jgi:hypothetical protein
LAARLGSSLSASFPPSNRRAANPPHIRFHPRPNPPVIRFKNYGRFLFTFFRHVDIAPKQWRLDDKKKKGV